MWSFIVFLFTVTAARAGYSGSASSSSGNTVGSGMGYAGTYSGQGQPPQVPQLPPVPNFDFQNFLTSYFDNLRKYHEEFATRFQQLHQNAAAGYGFPGGFPAFAGFPQGQGAYGGGYGGSYGGGYGGPASGGAAASASIGPGGVHQTAQVYPENPNSPNVDTRFGGSEGGTPGAGTYSVFTSSVSGSSDLDGKKTGYHHAQTTVNDNGKVTTYTSHNP